MSNPYLKLGERSFWSASVAKKNCFDIKDLWRPKFRISETDRVATYGSCFAQHFGKSLSQYGFNWYITEKAPFFSSETLKKQFNYEVFSSRVGNIYTASLFAQWLRWTSQSEKSENLEVWKDSSGFIDPFRPTIEPHGFLNEEELHKSRNRTLREFYNSIRDCQVLVFTLGLTECWRNSESKLEYPMCPGTAAGKFDSNLHKFSNQTYTEISENLMCCLDLMSKINPKIKILLTVSPVPLTATNSNNHVLVATSESKAKLRAVAGEFASSFENVDYFPSFEIINSVPFRGIFFESNMRNVNQIGVDHVMSLFFGSFGYESLKRNGGGVVSSVDESCDEKILDAFGDFQS